MHMYAARAAGVKLTTGQRLESYDGVHYSDLTYDAFAQVRTNIMFFFCRGSRYYRIVGDMT